MAKLKTQFNDLVDASSIEAEIATKANKTQEAFIAPTLLNSWVNYGSGFMNAGYMKDEFGFVHIRGTLKSGTFNNVAFTLPVGYRPNASIAVPGISGSLVAGNVLILTDGSVDPDFPAGTSTNFLTISNIKFKVGN
jgi:hypothetical protein